MRGNWTTVWNDREKEHEKFNALNCFVAPLQNWLRTEKKTSANYTYSCAHCLSCATLSQCGTHTHTPHHRLAYAILHWRIYSFLCRMCALRAWYMACIRLCTVHTILFSNLNGCTCDFFSAFFGDIFAQRIQVWHHSLFRAFPFHMYSILKLYDFFSILSLYTSLTCCTKFFVEWIVILYFLLVY